MKHILTFCAAILFPGTALSDITFKPPHACTKILTVQQRECRVENHWWCEQQQRGWTGAFGLDGTVLNLEQSDANGEMVSYQNFVDGPFFVTPVKVLDPLSISTLLETGQDDLELIVEMSILSGKAKFNSRSTVELTGEHEVIDGENLFITEVRDHLLYLESEGFSEERDAVMKNINYRAVRHAYWISLDDEMFVIGGTSRIINIDEAVEYHDHTPVEIIRPGEEGFFSKIPKYDCGNKTSQLELDIDDAQGNGREWL